MPRVYLETSLISACVSTRSDAASVYRRDVSREWMRDQAGRHVLFLSAEVYAELSSPSYPSREAALAIARQIQAVAIDEQVVGLADVLVREQVMPGPVKGDAIHVAACCVHEIEYLLSWNVRHLANPNKQSHLQAVCLRAGRLAPRIVTPDLLWDTL